MKVAVRVGSAQVAKETAERVAIACASPDSVWVVVVNARVPVASGNEIVSINSIKERGVREELSALSGLHCFFFFFLSKFLLWQLVPRDNDNVEKVLLLGSRHRVLLQRRFAEYHGRQRQAEAMSGSTAMAHELQRTRAETLRTT